MLVFSLKRKVNIDENLLAQDLSRLEGGAKLVDHAQIKEVQKNLLDLLGKKLETNPRGVIALLRKHGRDKKKEPAS